MGGSLSSVVIEKSLINVMSLLDNRRASAAASYSTTVHTSPEDPRTTSLDSKSTAPPPAIHGSKSVNPAVFPWIREYLESAEPIRSITISS
jgi:hypothetical protein